MLGLQMCRILTSVGLQVRGGYWISDFPDFPLKFSQTFYTKTLLLHPMLEIFNTTDFVFSFANSSLEFSCLAISSVPDVPSIYC